MILHDNFLFNNHQIENLIASHSEENKNNNNQNHNQLNESTLPIIIEPSIFIRKLTDAPSSCENSAAGLDNISFIFLKYLKPILLITLLESYNTIWTYQQFLAQWGE